MAKSEPVERAGPASDAASAAGVTSMRCASIARSSSIVHSQRRFAKTRDTTTSIGCVGKPSPRLSTASAARTLTRPGKLALRINSTSVLSASSLKDRATRCTSRAVATATSRRGRPGPPFHPGWKLAEVAWRGMPGRVAH
jgi:hypothetical protein